MNKDYYKEYYKLEREHWWFKVRGQIIIDQIRKVIGGKRDLNILNIGVATGRTTELLSEFGKVTSIEYDKECCEFTRLEVGIDVIQASVLALPFDNKSFDLVCSFDVIEHVEDDKTAVQEMKRVCKPNGIVCITVPAFMQLWSHHDVVNHHYRRYVMKQLIKLFEPQKKDEILFKSYFNSALFLPIWAFRLLSKIIPKKLIRKEAGSDFTVIDYDSFINKILYSVFNVERKLLGKITYPFGVSILFIWRKLE